MFSAGNSWGAGISLGAGSADPSPHSGAAAAPGTVDGQPWYLNFANGDQVFISESAWPAASGNGGLQDHLPVWSGAWPVGAGGRPGYHQQGSQGQPQRQNTTGAAGITTLMVRNLPRRVDLMGFLREVNGSGFAGLYNFAHIPQMDGGQCKNKTFAFVNFRTPAIADAFKWTWHKSQRLGLRGKSMLTVSAADVQGFRENIILRGIGQHRMQSEMALRAAVQQNVQLNFALSGAVQQNAQPNIAPWGAVQQNVQPNVAMPGAVQQNLGWGRISLSSTPVGQAFETSIPAQPCWPADQTSSGQLARAVGRTSTRRFGSNIDQAGASQPTLNPQQPAEAVAPAADRVPMPLFCLAACPAPPGKAGAVAGILDEASASCKLWIGECWASHPTP